MRGRRHVCHFFFFNDTATTEIYTLSLHDALPICFPGSRPFRPHLLQPGADVSGGHSADRLRYGVLTSAPDRKSTRLNSSHQIISYAVFCLKKKKTHYNPPALSLLTRSSLTNPATY